MKSKRKVKRKINRKRIILMILILFLPFFIYFIIYPFFKVEKLINLKNYTRNEAIEYLKNKEIAYEIDEIYDDAKENTVIKQSINEGTPIKKIKKIILTISLGINKMELYKSNTVNELGNIPVMMYHGIHNVSDSDTAYVGGNIDKDGYQRTKQSFMRDLEYYYENGYRMIRLIDYVNGKIDVEMGKSPIILTFDDGLKNNINILGLDDKGNIIIDPNSAIGILESYKIKYPDYNITATFFVNGGLFQQQEYNDKILEWLVNNGYDVGNHSYNHANFKNTDNMQTEKEIGKMYQLLETILEEKYVNIVALPFGSPGSMTHSNFPYVISGKFDNKEYNTISTLKVGSTSDYSPFSIKFNRLFINRIRAYDANGTDFDIEYNFNNLKQNRYISDGDVNTVVIKKEDRDLLNTTLKVIEY